MAAKAKPKLGRGQCRGFTRKDGRRQQVCNKGGRTTFGAVSGKPKPKSGGVAGTTRGKKPLGRGECRNTRVQGQKTRRYCNVNGTTKRVPLSYRK